MAHYVAELIEAAKLTPKDLQSNARDRCAKAILDLWAHRGALPAAVRPFEDLKPVIELLETLDPDLDRPYYRSNLWRALEADDANLDANVKRYLELVQGADYIARLVITDTLTHAVNIAKRDSATWVALAEEANQQRERDVELVIRLLAFDQADSSPTDQRRKKLTDSLKRMEAFIELATAMRGELENEIATLDGPANALTVRI